MALDPQALLERRFEPIGITFKAARGLDAHNVCWGAYRTLRQGLAEDARPGVANPVFERITTPGVGEHLAAGTALREQGRRPRPHARRRCSAPLPGDETDEVLHEVLRLPAGRGRPAARRRHRRRPYARPDRQARLARLLPLPRSSPASSPASPPTPALTPRMKVSKVRREKPVGSLRST